MRSELLPALLLLLPACATAASPDPAPASTHVRSWGAMREVLREGRTQGRVTLSAVLGPHSIAVGAAEGLAAEITVFEGAAHLVEVKASGSPGSPRSSGGLHARAPAPGEQATLLVLADVPVWSPHDLAAVSDLAALEAAIRSCAAATGLDVSRPIPFHVRGDASALRLHVLDHSCPIAAPDGPPPWRFSGPAADVLLVGFFAQGAAGRLTHHGQNSHTHAILSSGHISGHVDEVTLRPGARLFLPAR